MSLIPPREVAFAHLFTAKVAELCPEVTRHGLKSPGRYRNSKNLNDATMHIIGNKFLVDFGMAKAILDFQSPTSLTFTITEKEGMDVNIKETVGISLTQLRPQLFMATWKEASGTTVIQVQDYEQGIIYSHWLPAGGELTSRQGTLTPLNPS
jgi:hypothetical protein